MAKVLKSKKVIGAAVALVVAIVGVGLGVEIGGAETAKSITDVICQVVTCGE